LYFLARYKPNMLSKSFDSSWSNNFQLLHCLRKIVSAPIV